MPDWMQEAELQASSTEARQSAHLNLIMSLLHKRAFVHSRVARLLIESRCAFCGAFIAVSANVGLLVFIEALHSCPLFLQFVEEELSPGERGRRKLAG